MTQDRISEPPPPERDKPAGDDEIMTLRGLNRELSRTGGRDEQAMFLRFLANLRGWVLLTDADDIEGYRSR